MRQLTQYLLENQRISSAGYEAETALLEEFLQNNLELMEDNASERSKLDRQARREAQLNAEQVQSDLKESLRARRVITEEMTQPFLRGFGAVRDPDQRAAIEALEGMEFSSQEEAIKALTDAVGENARVWVEAGDGLSGYSRNAVEAAKNIEAFRENLRQEFKTAGIDAAETAFTSLGESIGQALVGSFEDSLPKSKRAQVKLMEMAGQLLTTIGSVAIAQGAIATFADPYSGGAPNPAKGIPLVAAGVAAVAVGSALSAKAGKIRAKAQKSKQGGGGGSTTTPATTGGGSNTRSSAVTNIFVENTFGTRFDAREMDRAAAGSFNRAISLGQA